MKLSRHILGYSLLVCLLLISCKQKETVDVQTQESIERAEQLESKKRLENRMKEILKPRAEKTPEKAEEVQEAQVKEEQAKPIVKQVKTEPKKEVSPYKKVNIKTVSKQQKTQQETKKVEQKGKLVFYKKMHNYGRIEMGEQVSYEFGFFNAGSEPVTIDNVEVSCGCTTPEYPFVPIEPGKRGNIKVHFNSEGRLGNQESIITVYSNGEEPSIELSLVGEVISEIVQPKIISKDTTKEEH